MSKTLTFEDLKTPEFRNKMLEFNKKIKRQNFFSNNYVKISLLLGTIISILLFISTCSSLEKNEYIISLLLIALPTYIFSFYIIGIFSFGNIFPPVYIDYKNKNLNILDITEFRNNFEILNSFTEMTKSFNVSISKNTYIDPEVINFIQYAENRGGLYNYEFVILYNIKKRERELRILNRKKNIIF